MHRFVDRADRDASRGFARWDGTAVLADGSRVSGHVYPLTQQQFKQVDRLFSRAVARSAVQTYLQAANGEDGQEIEPLACVMYQVVDSRTDPAWIRERAMVKKPAMKVDPPGMKQSQEDKLTIARGSWAAAAADGAALALKWGQSAPTPDGRQKG